jgi:hypothetical protein
MTTSRQALTGSKPPTSDPDPIDPDADLKADLATLGLTVDDLSTEKEPVRRPRPEGPRAAWVELPEGALIDITDLLNDA